MSRFNLEIGNEFKKFMGVAVAVAGRVTVSVSVCCNVTMLQGTRYKVQATIHLCRQQSAPCSVHITKFQVKQGILLIAFLYLFSFSISLSYS